LLNGDRGFRVLFVLFELLWEFFVAVEGDFVALFEGECGSGKVVPLFPFTGGVVLTEDESD